MNLFAEPALSILWLAIIVSEAIVFALATSRARERFPFFTAFTAFCVIRSLSLLALARPDMKPAYAVVYWSGCAAQILLSAAVLIEVFASVFEPVSTLPRRVVRRFITGLAVILIAAVALAFEGGQSWTWENQLRNLERSQALLSCAAFAFLICMTRCLGIYWRHRALGIAAGFLFFESVELAIASQVAAGPAIVVTVLRPVRMSAFLATLWVWTWYLSTAETPLFVPTPGQMERICVIFDRLAIACSNAATSSGLTMRNYGGKLGANKERTKGGGVATRER